MLKVTTQILPIIRQFKAKNVNVHLYLIIFEHRNSELGGGKLSSYRLNH